MIGAVGLSYSMFCPTHTVSLAITITPVPRGTLATIFPFGAANARISSLEGDVASLTGRVASLEATKADLEGQLTRAREKIATDDALLERVRRAMSIGLGLLEDQKNNTFEGSAE